MIGEYVRVTAAQLDRAVKDPQWASDFIDELIEAELTDETAEGGQGASTQSRSLDIDKAWGALGFLLRRRDFPVDIVQGEEAIPGAEDWGYGPLRYLTPAQVKVAATALAGLSGEDLIAGVSAQELARADVYPRVIWERGQSLDYVREHFATLVPFFQVAALEGEAMLIWLD